MINENFYLFGKSQAMFFPQHVQYLKQILAFPD